MQDPKAARLYRDSTIPAHSKVAFRTKICLNTFLFV